MTLKLVDKQAIVAELTQVIEKSNSAITADYRGLTVSEMTELRIKAREQGVYMRVVRNTLARRAVQDTAYACLQESLVGPLVLFFSQEDPGAAARVLNDFVKKHEHIEVRAIALDGELLAADQLKAVASLPTKEQSIAMLMSVIQAPITKTVRALAETYTKVVRVVGAVADQKQAEA